MVIKVILSGGRQFALTSAASHTHPSHGPTGIVGKKVEIQRPFFEPNLEKKRFRKILKGTKSSRKMKTIW